MTQWMITNGIQHDSKYLATANPLKTDLEEENGDQLPIVPVEAAVNDVPSNLLTPAFKGK